MACPHLLPFTSLSRIVLQKPTTIVASAALAFTVKSNPHRAARHRDEPAAWPSPMGDRAQLYLV
jgi:hypothetical protein